MGRIATARLPFCLWVGFCLLTIVFVARPTTQDAPPAVEGASGLELKLAEILDNAATTERPVAPVVVTQGEANGYLQDEGAVTLPTGVTEPSVAFDASGRISGRARVDLAAVSASRTRGMLDPLRYLTGQLPVTAAGFLRTDAGTGHLELERVTVAGLPVPQSVLQEIVRQYSKSDAYPNGVELTESFELPYRIREVRVRQAELVVEQ